MKKVLFVCLGNICRSPAAEGVFREMVNSAGLDKKILIDSAGTGSWHVGEPPDPRMIHFAKQRAYDLSDLEARQFLSPHDFQEFDYILTMDNENLKNVRAQAKTPEQSAKAQPLVNFCKIHDANEVPDPYHKQEDGFALVLDLLEDACHELLMHICAELKV